MVAGRWGRRHRLDTLCQHLLAPQCQLHEELDVVTRGASAEPAEHMLVVRGGTIIDGTGTSRFVADLAVGHDGKIASIGQGLGPGMREINATGKLVTPGFVDVHTHFDAQVCWDPYLAPAPHNGSTTIIFGNVSRALTVLAT